MRQLKSKSASKPFGAALWKRLLNWILENRICFASFLLPFACMMAIFIHNEIFPFGDRSFMHSDMYHQYVPFMEEFLRRVREGEFAHSWNIGLGSNYLALFIYYSASPFNWLMPLLPSEYLIEFMSYMVVFKIGLCGFTFAYYLKNKFRTKDFLILPFSVFYAMSGFVAAYNWNVMWIDCLVLAPLIILGLERLVKEGRAGLYTVTLALSILTNYYISIMICIFLCLYFLLLLLELVGTDSLKANLCRLGLAIGRFLLFSLLAGGMAAVLLFPELTALFSTDFTKSSFPKNLTWYFPFLDVLARHAVGVERETGLDHWPNIFCSSAVFFLMPLYLFNRRIRLREKLPRLLLCAFLIVSFSANTLTFLWHGFNYPDSLPCRQSFLYILLVLTMCFEVLHKKEGFTKTELVKCTAFGLLFLLFAQKTVDDDAFTTGMFLLTACLVLIYGLLLYLYKEICRPGWAGSVAAPTASRILAAALLATVTFEATFNMAHTSVSTTGRSSYLEDLPAYRALSARARQADPDFYRFEKFSRVTKNDGALGNYPTASLFSSTTNGDIADWYDRMGMSESKVFYCFDGHTPLSGALLNVRYMFSRTENEDPALYTLIDDQDGVYLYRVNHTLPAGFVLDDSWNLESESLEANSSDPFDLQNQMVASLGIPSVLFESQEVLEEGKKAEFSAQQSGHYYAYCKKSGMDEVSLSSDSLNKSFTKLGYDYIMDLGYHEAGDVMKLENKKDGAMEVCAALLNTDVLQEALSVIGQNPFTVRSFDTTHVNGTIDMKDPGRLVLSIPVEPGWKMFVDGEETAYEPYDDMFLSVSLDSGLHTIELSYATPGLSGGILVSCTSLIAFVILQLVLRRQEQ